MDIVQVQEAVITFVLNDTSYGNPDGNKIKISWEWEFPWDSNGKSCGNGMGMGIHNQFPRQAN